MPQQLNISWMIESIRITGFLKDAPRVQALEDWIESVSGNTPIQVNKSGTSFSGVSRCIDGFLRVNWSDNRIDAFLQPTEPTSTNVIAPFSEFPRLYDGYVKRFPDINEFPAINRLAMGIVLTCTVDNEQVGLKLLQPAIRGLNLDPRTRDFQYRLNIPFESHTQKGLLINRLVTWSIVQIQMIHLQFGSDGSSSQEIVNMIPTALHLELDINTDQNTTLGIDASTTSMLLSEMQMCAIDIINNGESAMLS
jgi:hypothetical protein